MKRNNDKKITAKWLGENRKNGGTFGRIIQKDLVTVHLFLPGDTSIQRVDIQ